MQKVSKIYLLIFQECLRLDITGLDENKFAQVCNITRHFYLSCFRRVVNSTLDKVLFDVHYKIVLGKLNVIPIHCTLTIF